MGGIWPSVCTTLSCLPLQKESQIFPPTTGGAETMCQDLNIPLLGKVPLDPHIGNAMRSSTFAPGSPLGSFNFLASWLKITQGVVVVIHYSGG